MKAIRIQIDMLYKVPDEDAQAIYDFDVSFFHNIKEQMEAWNDVEGEPRNLINAEIRHHIGEVDSETNEDEKDIPLDGTTPTSS